jgi:opacity protein-like surface antigen
MRKILAMAVAASALAMAAPAAAQSWQTINERQRNLDARIDAGVRSGDLTRNEAMRLRGEFRDLARLEARYRSSNGLSMSERRDLDMRFDRLSAQIRFERHDRNDRYGRNWQPINQRQNMLENRINAGIRSGRLDRREAYRLRAEFQQIANIEARYRRNGLSYEERRDLDRRFDRLSAQLNASLNDRDRWRG